MGFHITRAHAIWKEHVQKGDTVIDATCGNGHDAAFLASLVGEAGTLLCIDIQEAAIQSTKARLGPMPQAHYLHASHEDFPSDYSPSLIVYNLGYLPGSDKIITTQTESTLTSIQNGLRLLKTGGMLSITCYPGHPEGRAESAAVSSCVSTLKGVSFSYYAPENRPLSPNLTIIHKLK